MIISKPNTPEWEENFDRIFGKKGHECPACVVDCGASPGEDRVPANPDEEDETFPQGPDVTTIIKGGQ